MEKGFLKSILQGDTGRIFSWHLQIHRLVNEPRLAVLGSSCTTPFCSVVDVFGLAPLAGLVVAAGAGRCCWLVVTAGLPLAAAVVLTAGAL